MPINNYVNGLGKEGTNVVAALYLNKGSRKSPKYQLSPEIEKKLVVWNLKDFIENIKNKVFVDKTNDVRVLGLSCEIKELFNRPLFLASKSPQRKRVRI
ncbi:MAG: hypothetical protein LBO03_07055 [Acidaminococcales bacterium]|jgi:hypothetical protein|nr:hypothetical protein [Acidaminococcales bacterium]